MQQIADWFKKLGMSEYAQRFAENRVDFSVLPDVTDQDLEKLGVVLGDRRKTLRAIANRSTVSVELRPSDAVLCRDRFVNGLSRLHNRGDDLIRFLLTEDLNCCRSHVSLRGERQEKLGDGIITSTLRMDDEVIGSNSEIACLDINAKFFAQLLGGRSALRHFLNSPDALVGEIAEQHVGGHGNPPSTKKAVGSYRVHTEDYAIRTIRT
jgi:SAM domain (Sterile alpha motif)